MHPHTGALRFPPVLANPNPPKEHQFKPGNPGGPGRPSKMALWREEVEAEFDKWIAGFLAARDSGNPDAQMKAAKEVFDRVYGRPNQRVQHEGEINVRHSLLDKMKEDQP